MKKRSKKTGVDAHRRAIVKLEPEYDLRALVGSKPSVVVEGDSESMVPPSIRAAADWLGGEISAAAGNNDYPALLRFARDRAFVLLKYFCAADLKELSRLRFSDISFEPSTLAIAGCNRRIVSSGKSRFCPIAALRTWLFLSGIESGPVFRRVKGNGRLADEPLFPGDLKNIFEQSVLLARMPETYRDDIHDETLSSMSGH